VAGGRQQAKPAPPPAASNACCSRTSKSSRDLPARRRARPSTLVIIAGARKAPRRGSCSARPLHADRRNPVKVRRDSVRRRAAAIVGTVMAIAGRSPRLRAADMDAGMCTSRAMPDGRDRRLVCVQTSIQGQSARFAATAQDGPIEPWDLIGPVIAGSIGPLAAYGRIAGARKWVATLRPGQAGSRTWPRRFRSASAGCVLFPALAAGRQRLS